MTEALNLSLAVAILDQNLKGPTATFDETGLSAVRSAWLAVRAHLDAERSDKPRETDQSNPSLGTGGEENQGVKGVSRTNSADARCDATAEASSRKSEGGGA